MDHDMTTADGQMAAAKARGLKCVTHKNTGARGWVTQEFRVKGGYEFRVRWAGVKGGAGVARIKTYKVDVDPS